ncbi:MAG: STAS domain-containing protein [Candidatus Ozemobacteraceae bacterium]
MEASIRKFDQESVPTFVVTGYFDEDLGKELNAQIDIGLIQGKNHVIVDFSACPVINSLGVAQLLELTVRVDEDFAGKIFLVGVSPVIVKVLRLAGVVPQANLVDSLTTALQRAKAG